MTVRHVREMNDTEKYNEFFSVPGNTQLGIKFVKATLSHQCSSGGKWGEAWCTVT